MDTNLRNVIRSFFPYSANRINLDVGHAYKDKILPRFLYKYRSFCETHWDCLERGTLWFSSPSKFNDVNDSIVGMRLDCMTIPDLTPNEIESDIKLLRGGASVAELPKRPQTPRVELGALRKRSYDELLQHYGDIGPTLVNAMEGMASSSDAELIRQLSDAYRLDLSVLSLSAHPLSNPMWSHYSDNHCGFAIEYDIGNEQSVDRILRRACFPVLYRNRTIDNTRYFSGEHSNPLSAIFVSLIKSAEWSYEREWRIVFPTGSQDANFERQMPVPTAILLGTKVSPANKLKMQEFCAKNSIPLKQTEQSPGSFDLRVSMAP
jgi:hypothetical protein